ncbi:MAG: hypothetical protein WAW86_05685 [Gammaproteobacteria bacterium]
MSRISGFFSALAKRAMAGNRGYAENFVFYKIINFDSKNKKYLLQCINSKATFNATLKEIVDDQDIVGALHPIQSCYVGIEYANYFSQIPVELTKNTYTCSQSRYGKYSLRFLDRKKNVGFLDCASNSEMLMDPRDIALSNVFIKEFDSIHAFYIGIQAGVKMNKTIAYNLSPNKPKLRLIK